MLNGSGGLTEQSIASDGGPCPPRFLRLAILLQSILAREEAGLHAVFGAWRYLDASRAGLSGLTIYDGRNYGRHGKLMGFGL